MISFTFKCNNQVAKRNIFVYLSNLFIDLGTLLSHEIEANININNQEVTLNISTSKEDEILQLAHNFAQVVLQQAPMDSITSSSEVASYLKERLDLGILLINFFVNPMPNSASAFLASEEHVRITDILNEFSSIMLANEYAN